MNPTPLVSQLSTEHGTDYSKKTIAEFSQRSRVPVTYTWDTPEWSTEGKIKRLVKFIFSIIFFPIAIYHFLHYCIGKVALPASSPLLIPHIKNLGNLNRLRADAINKIFRNTLLNPKRLTISVDGYEIDAAIVGHQINLTNSRWVLLSVGNGEFYEQYLDNLSSSDLGNFLSKLEANVLMFNYPGVGESSGRPNHQAMVKAYRAMLHFLEDDKEGLGAKVIVGFGHSIGGGIQGEALQHHTFRKDIRYTFIKNKTFSTLSKAAETIIARPIGSLIRFFGWDINAGASSKTMTVPEIIIQKAAVRDTYTVIDYREQILHDQIIPSQGTLAAALIEDRASMKGKQFLGTPEDHNVRFEEPAALAKIVQGTLPPNPLLDPSRAQEELNQQPRWS